MLDSEIDETLREWEARQPQHERDDPIWGLLAYRLSRFVLDAAQADARCLARARRPGTLDQLLRAVASVSANFAEGYSRITPADRARFYAYALGSVRESASWYSSLRDALGDPVVDDRLVVLSRVRRLVFGALKSAQRANGRSSAHAQSTR